MIRALSILTAIVALTVSAAPGSAATPEAAKGVCNVPGFMDYTDDSCMAKPRWGSAPPAYAVASHYAAKNRMSIGMSMGKPMVEW